MNPIIKIENLSKMYRLGVIGTGTISHDLNRWWHKTRGKEDPYLKIGESNISDQKSDSNYVWALKDINLEIMPGEVLGIIGKNGAGKSTLLKILSKVTGPTTGSIKYKGRIGSLLEVGTGFHGELTGRENIFLNGAILGMTKAEIRSKLDEIVDFAGVERYIDTPVKRYSSGMMVRLGFAVAAHLEPEILVVDEVLAVGDAEFQKKAIGKMQDVSKNKGRTILFVSHNMTAVKSLCTKGMVLKNGTIDFIGNEKDAVKQYLYGKNYEITSMERVWHDDQEKPGNDAVRLRRIEIKPIGKEYIDTDTNFKIILEIENYTESKNIDCSIHVLTSDEIIVFTAGSFLSTNRDSEKALYHIAYEIPAYLLNAGYYKIDIVIGESQKHLLSHFQAVISFEIQNTLTGRGSNMKRAPGIVKPKIKTTVEIEKI